MGVQWVQGGGRDVTGAVQVELEVRVGAVQVQSMDYRTITSAID